MRVLIAGGGIGGLTAALSLHAAGIADVVVAEEVDELRPLGVGINLLPHAVRELTELGLAERLAGVAVPTAELAYFNRFGQRIWSEPRGLAAGYRWPQFSVHRGELQTLLLEAVRERLGPGTIRLGHAFRDIRQQDGVEADFVTSGGAVTLRGDVLIGADGIRSTLRSRLYPGEGAPLWNGLVLWRGISKAPPFLTGRSMIMAGDGTEKMVAYPLDQGDPASINWIAERPAGRSASGRAGWNQPIDPAEVLRFFGGWRFDWLDVPGLIASASTVYEYPMVDRDPLPRWTHGRVTLLGDAAHPLYPIGSNGASQAILDARVLAYELAVGPSPEAALTAYEERRRPVTAAICLANRRMGPEVVMKLAAERAPDGFADIDQVIPAAEREAIAADYKRAAGFYPVLLNERASYGLKER